MSYDYNSAAVGLGLSDQVVASPTGLMQAIITANSRGGGIIRLQPGVTYTWDGSKLTGEYENIRIVGAGPPGWTFASGLVGDATGSVISLINPPTADNTYYFNGLVIEDVILTAPIAWVSTQRGLLGGNLNQNIWFRRCLIVDFVPPLRKNCGPNIWMEDCFTGMTSAAALTPIATSIVVGASPFDYQNTSGSNQIVYVTGGTVSAQTVAAVAIPKQSTYGVRLTNNQHTIVTYSVAPTMYSAQISGNIQGDQGPSWFTRCIWDYHPSQEFAVGFAGYSKPATGAYYFKDCQFGTSGLYSMDAWIDTESNPATAVALTSTVDFVNNVANNPSGGPILLQLIGGTVTAATVTQNGVGTALTAGQIASQLPAGVTLAVGDKINATFSPAPTTQQFLNAYLPECVVDGCTIVNGKVYAINAGKYSIVHNDFRLTTNYNGTQPHFVHTYNPNGGGGATTDSPGPLGQLLIKGNTFRQPTWGTLTPVLDMIALQLSRDGPCSSIVVEDNDFYLSNLPTGTDLGASAPIVCLASSNCPFIGNLILRNNRFGFVETGGTSRALVQTWSDNATTGGGIGNVLIDGMYEIPANMGLGDAYTPVTVAPIYTWPINAGLAGKTSTFGKWDQQNIITPSATNFPPPQKLGTWTLASGSFRSRNLLPATPTGAGQDITGASPVTVGPFNNGTAYTLTIKNPVLVAIDVATTTSITITLQTAGGTTRTIYPTGVPNVLVPFFIPVMVGDVLTMTFTVANPTHIWVLPFSSGL